MQPPRKRIIFAGHQLEVLLFVVFFLAVTVSITLMYLLKKQHDLQAHLSATNAVLERGEALLDAVDTLSLVCSTNASPEIWRDFSTIVDNTFAVRKDLQSLSVTRDGVTVFQRHATRFDLTPETTSKPEISKTNTAIVQKPKVTIERSTVETSRGAEPVFVISRTFTLTDNSRVTTTATIRLDAIWDEEQTARRLVGSLYILSTTISGMALLLCAIVLTIAVVRDRKRLKQAHQEEHLAFSGVLANGILHDFRNPMSAVKLDSQMLAKEIKREAGFRKDRVMELATRLTRTIQRMEKIFQEFLSLARPADEAEQIVDIQNVIKECMEMVAPRTEQGNITLQYIAPDKNIMVRIQPLAIQRALLNIMVNAIQFAPGNTTVEIELTTHKQNIDISIRDQGSGFPANRLKDVFNLFVTTRPEGTGLGLFLARSAVQRCGGTITARNRKNQGAEVLVSLPWFEE